MATSTAVKKQNNATKPSVASCFSHVHTTPAIAQPHTLLVGQTIPLSQDVLDTMGIESYKVQDSTFIDNYSTWIDLIRFGLPQQFISDKSATQFIQAKKNTIGQAEKLKNIKTEFLLGLDKHLQQTSKTIVAQTNLHDLPLADHLIPWAKGQFSYEVTFSQGNDQNYGCSDTLGLRVDARNGLSVLSIDCLEKAPIPLQRIGGQLLYFLCYLAEKSQSQDLAYGCHSHCQFSEFVDGASQTELTTLVALTKAEQYDDALELLKNSDRVDIEEINNCYGDDIHCAVDECADFSEWWLGFHHMNSHLTENVNVNDTENFLTSIQSKLDNLSMYQNPVIGHPFYTHLLKLVAMLSSNIKHQLVQESFIESGSDNHLNNFSIVSVSNYDDEYLNDVAENINSCCEYGSHIISMKNPQIVLDYFHNMILADTLLLAFDMD